jgi:hypothetical protein
VGSLLHKVEDLLRESLVGLGPCGAVVFGHGSRGVVMVGFTAEARPKEDSYEM